MMCAMCATEATGDLHWGLATLGTGTQVHGVGASSCGFLACCTAGSAVRRRAVGRTEVSSQSMSGLYLQELLAVLRWYVLHKPADSGSDAGA